MLLTLEKSGPLLKAFIVPHTPNSKGFQILNLPLFSFFAGVVVVRVSLPTGEKPKVVRSDLNGKIYDLFIS